MANLQADPGLVLVLNAGSSSLKFALYDSPDAARLIGGLIEQPASGNALELVIDQLAEYADSGPILAIGHRVVHGGQNYREPVAVDAAMLVELQRLRVLDPEHLPSAIRLMHAVSAKFPDVPQFACFDTTFHNTMPRVASVIPIPRRYQYSGIRRYGFHGLSCAYLMKELARRAGPAAASGRVVLAHLGNGASLTAVRDGASVDTTMGLTPGFGLVMGTRAGDVDPGLPVFLAATDNMTLGAFDHMVNHESGLLGISGTSADMRTLLASEGSDARAAEAVNVFCYQVRKGIGAYAAAMGGIDTLVFSGGIGENASPVRARICNGLAFLGVELDEARNSASAEIISTDSSRVPVLVIRTDEETMIAESVWRLLGATTHAMEADT